MKKSIVMFSALAVALTTSLATASPHTVYERGVYQPYVSHVVQAEKTDETSGQVAASTTRFIEKVFIGERITKEGKLCHRTVTKLARMDSQAADIADDSVVIENPTILTEHKAVACPS